MRLRTIVTIGCLWLAAGCGDREGLEVGDGGGAGGGGAGGRGGAGGGKGGSSPDMRMCGPVCAIYCPNGNVLDANGCPTCQCKPAVCPAIKCAQACANGYQKDANGCQTCQCNPPPACQPVTCRLYCASGFKKDANGCEICECNLPTCQTAECGPPVPLPALMCPSSPTGTGVAVCRRNAQGTCTWMQECPAPDCAQIRDRVSCSQWAATCTWLEPGCTQPAIAAAGCYSRTALGCDTRPCPAGKQCVQRTVNPCSSGTLTPSTNLVAPPGGGAPAPPVGDVPVTCGACAQTVSICL